MQDTPLTHKPYHEVVWHGTPNPICDLHKAAGLGDEPALYDGRTDHGPWALMCQDHFDTHGVGTGEGKGQRLIFTPTNDDLLLDEVNSMP